MTDLRMVVDVLFIILLVVVAAGAIFAVVSRARRSQAQLDAEGLLADAEVLEIWQDGTGSYVVRYRYAPEGGEPVTRSEVAACLRAALPEVGARVRVRYDPREPRRARLLLDPGSCAT
jgi:hypothetical protein